MSFSIKSLTVNFATSTATLEETSYISSEHLVNLFNDDQARIFLDSKMGKDNQCPSVHSLLMISTATLAIDN